MTLGIRVAMLEHGISSVTIAKFLGLHPNTVSRKLRGNSEFTIGEAMRLQRELFPEYDFPYLFLPVKEDG